MRIDDGYVFLKEQSSRTRECRRTRTACISPITRKSVEDMSRINGPRSSNRASLVFLVIVKHPDDCGLFRVVDEDRKFYRNPSSAVVLLLLLSVLRPLPFASAGKMGQAKIS
ncbi:hypothetical protein ARMGADRAFT_93227 [Armillaria gallica]|uniref:Uncharacterized protein n=1 Tax=Armillaria gallica TaxID=47427 RepID=A0A2H3DH30_ARMGA|nr:hypothetical protein ARMGADRAFT_93227 [Armillaria gallica]